MILCLEILAVDLFLDNLYSFFLYEFHGYVHNDHFSQGKENNSVATTFHTHYLYIYITIKAMCQKAPPN